MSNTPINFSIFHRDQHANVTSLNPTDIFWISVAAAANKAIITLRSKECRDELSFLAFHYDNKSIKQFHGKRKEARRYVDWFLDQLLVRPVGLVIDELSSDPNSITSHPRHPWQGTLYTFNPQHQAILLNAKRISDMIFAGQYDLRQWSLFQFNLANALVHEIGAHLLLTGLSNGRIPTPPRFSAPGYSFQGQGESGRWLEQRLFGGNIEFYVDRSLPQGAIQGGLPYLITQDGYAYQVDPSYVQAFIQEGIRTFPYPIVRRTRAIPSSLMPIGGPTTYESMQRALQNRTFMARFERVPLHSIHPSDIHRFDRAHRLQRIAA